MLSTGCSGSTLSFINLRVIDFLKEKSDIVANAVRYGTAKGEWFLNAVRFYISLI